MRLVLDTSILVSAERSRHGASRRLLEMGLRSRFDWLVSAPLIFEYEAVMCREEHLRVSGTTASDVNRLLDIICRQAIRINIASGHLPRLPDPNDEHVLQLALEGTADAVITYNVKHFASLPESFGVKLYSPADVLRILEGP